ncbi:hypothetical protein [Nostoc sp. PA-18-2419]|uniref:hypothetical protein n=1 Tax=Nostoc sp. PA-18-2419 TaxID=2575443 RepID=UPI001109CE5D|nr:hypothetical protein [Nostoc sp. PA-18-2419]
MNKTQGHVQLTSLWDFQLKKYSIPAGRYANALRAGEQGAGGEKVFLMGMKLDNLFSGSHFKKRGKQKTFIAGKENNSKPLSF